MVTLFFAGDVMTGRGIDQILPFPSLPHIHEFYLKDARDYIGLSEALYGNIDKPVNFEYIWGDALFFFDTFKPDAKMINLETAITTSSHWQKNKNIHYRMHPKNIYCLTAAKIDCVALANNHVLDWGVEGLKETLQTLHQAGIKTAGAGVTSNEATKPALLELSSTDHTKPNPQRVLFFSYGALSSGIYEDWRATSRSPGVALLDPLSTQSVHKIAKQISEFKTPHDIVILSIHWGMNWGYDISEEQRQLARMLIDIADVDVIHGHSSHHVKGIEVYHNKLILYGCGDLITDYEGIQEHMSYRGDLSLLYFANLNSKGELTSLDMIPMQIKHFRLQQANNLDAIWLQKILNREKNVVKTWADYKKQEQILSLKWE